MQAMSRNSNDRRGQQHSHTHQLPYGVRRGICQLLDADHSWRLLGGQLMRLDSTQLQLVGQAVLRNGGSPTEELLNKLDTANARTSQLYDFLYQMQHLRALELLKPYVIAECQENQAAGAGAAASLHTPTPSFNSIQPMAIMSPSEFDMIAPADYQNQNPNEWEFVDGQSGQKEPSKCHKQQQQQQEDPGDEIVRLACTSNRKRTSISQDEEVVNQLRLIMQINYNELKLASNDFADANILGNGGFASVYRGYWKGTDVAIKRLRCNLMDQALNELTILNSYRIDNILPIYGISIDGPEACLVYQFMANGSLEDRLSCKSGSSPLSWHQRAQIAEGVAKGLYYLHTLRDKPLVHGDAKSANVLLDSQFVPKLGDFGLARQVFRGKNPQQTEHAATHCTVSSIHGTSVYLPPEYLRHKILSPAVDVYSFGIVLLEMATGKRAYDGKRLLIDHVEDELKRYNNNQAVNYNLKDQRLNDNSTSGLKICFELLLRLGVQCAHKIKKKRPDMGQVLNNFAHFRSATDSLLAGTISQEVDMSLVFKGLSAQSSQVTTRTLTPDVNFTSTGVNENGFVFRQQQPVVSVNQQQMRQNSALMSVDEECELAQNNSPYEQMPNQQQQQQQQVTFNNYEHVQQETNQQDVLIPFLTELGISTTTKTDERQENR